jgi:hypothetical protein
MVRKKRTIAKSRAASLKGWRTKQRMQEARSMPTADDSAWYHAMTVVERLPPLSPPWDDLDIDQTDWPAYMRRALPNPWLTQ